MNSNYTMNSAATRTLRALWATLCLLAMLWVVPTQAQISYVEGFAGCDAATCNNWTIAGGYAPSLSPNDPFGEGYTPCVAANPAAKTNLYSAALTTTLTSNASVGTSNGQLATLGFSYKVIDYLTSATTPAGEAEVSAWYSETSNTGPWTQIGSAFTNAATGTCIASPSFTFTPSNGSPVFIQIRGTNLLPDFDGFWLVIDDISVAQGAGSNCNATPAPGNTISSVPNVCSGTNFTLSLQNATSGDGVTYQWQRDTGMGFQNFGTSSPTQVVSQTQATTYRCIVTCPFSSPTDGTSTPVSVGMTSYLTCYCNSVTFTSNVETISLVQFSNINNSSACGVGLPPANPFIEDFTSITGNVFKGIPYTMTVSGETDGNFTTFFTAFFDFDQDGIFEANFPIGSITNTSCVTTVSNSVLIPVGAATGVSRMRIIKVFAASPTNPCGTYGFGQAEDYLVNVQPPPACTEPAAPGATLSTAASVCDGESFTLSMSTPPLGGYTYDWQSADDAGFTVNVQTGLGTGLTYVASQSTAKYYRCVVTCVTAVPSTPLQVTMNTAFLPVDFTPVTFPPNCWTLSAPPADLLSRQAPSAFGVGTGSARFNFFGVTSGTQSMISPVLGATPANYQVRFDIAGTTFTGGEVDTVYAEASIDGGTSWTILATMLNNVGGLANTIGATSGLNFVPTAGQWNTLTFPVPTGANRLRFRGGSNFGNQVYLDNIVLEAIPTCIAPTLAGLTAATTSSTSFQINWVVQPTAVSYDVEVRTDALAPESPGAFLTDNTAATTYNVTAGLVVGQTYSVYVRSQCGVNGTSAWTGPRAYVHDYCVAGAGALGDPTQVIANFTFAGINQNNASNAGYLNFTSPQLAIVAPGVPTPFTRTYNTTYSNDSLHIWIDLDGDLVFEEPGELVAAKLSPDLNGTITIPNGTAPIVTRLRMRRFAFGTGLGGGAPCGIAPFGQVHDYTVEICGAMQGTTSITDNCGTGTFSIGVNVSALGTGPNPQIGYSVNGGGTQYLNAPATGPYTLDNGGLGFAQTDVVLVTLENGSPCLTTIGNHYGNCPITINCPSVYNLPQAHCYRASDPRTWEFISSDALQTVRLTFSQGCLDAGDNIIFRQFNGGPQISTTPVISGPADLTGQVITSDGQTLFVEIVSDLVGNCFDGACTTPWLFSVQCTPDCEPPSASAGSVIQNCGTNTYQVPITINSTEDGSPVDVEWLINGISSGTVSVGVGSTENIPAAGVPFGSTLNVNVLHASNDLCDLSNVGGTFNPASTCPPANDDCANATVIPVLPSGGCLWTNANVYTTANATYSSPATTCGTGGVSPVIRDVWLTFNVGATQAPLYMYYEAGTVTGLQMELYTGTGCGDLTPLAGGCLAAQDLVLNTPPAGLSYYIRFISNSTTGVPGTFRYCVTGSPTCGGNPTGNAPTLAQITGNSAQINWTVPAAGNWILEYGPAATFLVPSTGATGGPNSQVATAVVTGTAATFFPSCMNPATTYRMFIRRNCGGGDFSVNSRFRGTTFNTLAAPPAATPVTESTCAQAAAIPDGGAGLGCAINNSLNRSIAVTAPGTQLGVDVQLESVDLIISHLSRGQLRVRLVAPDGCERQMILVRGGTGDNFGNPTACPAQPFKLKDGATAVALSGTANNVVGTFAPEEPLTSFTGNPTGTWHIRICDGTAATTGTLDYVKLNFVTCVGPTATRSVVPACGTNQFFVAVNVTNMGTASSYTITNNIDGSTVNVPGVGVYNAGPFTSGANVTVTLVHSDDVSCNAVLPAISYTCPPANDDCANAILLTPGAVCNPVAGTVLGSTQSAPNSTCDGFGNTADDDVWYRFVATRTEHRIIFNAQFDGVVELRTSPCNGTIIDCEDNNFGAPFIETLTVPGLTIGTTYYIRAFSWSAALPANPNFTICVVAPDCLGAYGGPAIPGAACSDGDPNTLLDAYNSNCVCEGLPCTTDLAIDFTMDASSNMNWELRRESDNAVAQSGSTILGATEQTVTTCLPNGNWYMVVTDEQGDGITGGGYVVRRTNGTLVQPYTRVFDNRNNYAGVTPSQVSGPPVSANAFNIPLSTDRLIYTSCDKMDWRTTCGGEYVVATDNPAVTAQYGVTNSTSGYEMWWFAPNGGYSFRRTQYHSTTNGLAASATRACHFKPNTWAGSPLQPNTLYNVKVRSIVAGVPGNWGPACRFAIDNTLAGCPLTKLMDIPDNQYLSCGQMRLANSTSTYVYARNVRRMTGSCTWQNANRYQFRFRIVGEGINVVKTSATNQIFVNTVGLLCGKTYQVDVRASFNNGANWCVTTPSGINDPAWGDVCTLTTNPCAPAQGGNQNMVAEESANGLKMYPNPNRGDQLLISLEGIEQGVNTVSIDIYDAFGKRAIARTIPVNDEGYINSMLDLNGSLAAGLYTVSITAGERQFNERLVIQP